MFSCKNLFKDDFCSIEVLELLILKLLLFGFGCSNQLPLACYSWQIPSPWVYVFLVYKLVIFSGIPELVIPGRITIYPIFTADCHNRGKWASVGISWTNNLPNGNNSRIPYSEGQSIFFKFKFKNVDKMKNKPDPALLQTSSLSNEIKKGSKIQNP
jgi:hypothetical protein